MESSKSEPVRRIPEPAPATPDGTPPYADPAPDELDLSGPDRMLRPSVRPSELPQQNERDER